MSKLGPPKRQVPCELVGEYLKGLQLPYANTRSPSCAGSRSAPQALHALRTFFFFAMASTTAGYAQEPALVLVLYPFLKDTFALALGMLKAQLNSFGHEEVQCNKAQHCLQMCMF